MQSRLLAIALSRLMRERLKKEMAVYLDKYCAISVVHQLSLRLVDAFENAILKAVAGRHNIPKLILRLQERMNTSSLELAGLYLFIY